MVFALVALVLVVCIGVWLVLRRRQGDAYAANDDARDAPQLVIPVRASARGPAEPLPPPPPLPVSAPVAVAAPAPPPPAAPLPVRGTWQTEERSTGGPPHPEYLPREGPTSPLGTNGSSGSSVSDKVVHTIPVADGTLQFLPGRLEIIDGEKRGRDIRFVRTWGEIPEITFGRVTGPSYRHVQLKSQTVSRQHARMQYTDGRWSLINLSQTNPVIVNGEMLDPTHGQCLLRDGDQIEMGEVIFRFRER